MGILSTIGAALLGRGTDHASDNVMTVAKGIGNWIDEQQFTEAEKAEYNKQLIENYAVYMQNVAVENTARSRSRRAIALWIIRVEIFFLLMSAAVYRLDPEWSKYLYQIATDSPLGLLTLGIGAFFFGTHMIRAAK